MFYQFWVPFLGLAFAVVFCEKKWCMLRDLTQPKPQPYSWSRVQLAWWTVIVLASFIAITWKGYVKGAILIHEAPNLHESAIALLGISALTSVTARTMDASTPTVILPGSRAENFFLDILSDHNGISISRFQTVIFNLAFGIWYIAEVINNLAAMTDPHKVMPAISTNNLVLLGLSSATYAAMKITENKEKKKQAEEENLMPAEPVANDMIEPAIG